jgi:drug/metabolite transporter (DMT)-like permease
VKAKSIAQFVTVVLIWGFTWIIIKGQLDAVNPSWSVAFRFGVAGIALAGWCLIRGLPFTIPRASLPFLGVFGLAQFVLNFNLVYRAEQYIPSGIPAVAFALLMVPNAILAALFLKRPISRRFILGSLLGIAGVAMLFAQQLAFPGDRADTIKGLLLVTGGVLAASVANVMQATPRALAYPALPGLAVAMLIAAAMNAVLAFAIAGPPDVAWSWPYVGGVLYLGVVASAIAFGLYFDLLRTIGPAEAAWTGVPIPILAMAISTFVEGYRWTPLAAVGVVVALTGLVVALRQPAPKLPGAQA